MTFKKNTLNLLTLFTVTSAPLMVSLPAFANDISQTENVSETAALLISGTVVDENNTPVSGAKVGLAHTNHTASTNDAGYYELLLNSSNKGQFKPDHLELHISADGFSHLSEEVNFPATDASNAKQTNLTVNFDLASTVMEVIDIYATPLHSSSIESALPVNVLTSDDLRLKQSSNLGDTLKGEVGIHASSYGGVVSNPIIRGLDGARVLIAQNSLDVGDVSRSGADHAIAAESSTAIQVEVLRGPATLFYGSGAIGGVVNVVDNRVPNTQAKNTGFEADYFAKHSSVDNENEASVSLNYGAENFALHADAFARKSDDYELAEPIEETEEEHAEHEGDDDHEEHADEMTTLENSNSKSSGFTVGASYLFDNGFAGVSFGQLDKEYGIPFHSHAHHEEEHEEEEHEEEEHEEEHEESVIGKYSQQRVQFISEVSPNLAYINKISAKVAYSSYKHEEIEEGFNPTTLDNNLLEARADIHHPAILGWDGALTFHHKNNDFTASGDEAFTPSAETTTWAAAVLEEKHFGDVLVQLGARVEQVEISADLSSLHEEDHSQPAIDYTPISLSAGSVWDFKKGYNLGVSLSYAQRAPSSNEVFANGAHIGTNTYDLGTYWELEQEGDEYHAHGENTEATLETSSSIDLSFRKFEGDFGFIISSFYSEINDYYYQENTGLTSEDLHHDEHEEEGHEDEVHEEGEEEHHDDEGMAVFQYQLADVRLYGVESEFHYQATPQLKVSLLGDYIRAKLKSGGNLPRIPPLRITGELNYQADSYSANLSWARYSDQEDIAELETNTDGYNMVSANVNYYINGFGDDLVLFLKGDNLTNETAYVHSSFIKDVAPLPGRNISVGVRGSF